MPYTTLLLLLVFSLGFAAAIPTQAGKIIYVKPSEETKCPGEPCHTLDDYVKETSHHKNFPYSDTIMEFLPGTHNLSEAFYFQGASNLTWTTVHLTTNETFIFCKDLPRKLNFGRGSLITINGLIIVNCHGLYFDSSADITISRITTQDISAVNVQSITVSDVTIQHPPRFGIFLGPLSGDSVLEQIEVIGLPSAHNTAVFAELGNANYDSKSQSDTFQIRNCCFEHQVRVITLHNHGYNEVIFENVTYRHIIGLPLSLQQETEDANTVTVVLRNVIFADNNRDVTSVVDTITMSIVNFFNVTFIDCEFYNNLGTAISATSSSIQFSSSIVFQNNTGYEGGAMSFNGGSHIYISSNANVTFANNTAENVGGAVFVNQATAKCFFRQTSTEKCTHCHQLPFHLNFIDNIARRGGDAIYGAGISKCGYCGKMSSYCPARGLVFSAHSGLKFDPHISTDTSQISSDPTHVCLCGNGKRNCSITSQDKTPHVYPGEEFTISAMDIGDMNGPVGGSVYAQILPQYNRAVLGELQHFQQVNHTRCAELKYSILSEPGLVVIALTVTTARILRYQDNSPDVFYINITLLDCPLGFNLSDYPYQCICDPQLKKNNIPCDITTQTIERSGTVWVKASFTGNISNGVIVHKYCPFGYCKTEEVHVNLKEPDTQCAFKHSGILCGACQSELSLALGSPRCLDHCSNRYISLLLAFAAAGLIIVFFIKILDLTVAVGTINGLIFYANIVKAAQDTFIPVGHTNVLTVFIAWLNLDLGIETCFFKGLDGYWKTWLQFVFPFYIWAIIILIIFLSHYSQTIARIFGNNSVPVLATLILLSYTKLLRTIVIALSFTFLQFPDGSETPVWLFDGSIPYFGTKHTPLFLFALGVLLFLWLPFTVLLLFEPCFQRIGTYTVRKWMLRLKPFFDAYFGPLRGNHRYWVGVLLVTRGILLLVFGLNSTNDPSVNLLAVITVVVILIMYSNNRPGGHTDMNAANNFGFGIDSCYKKWYLSLLESSFFCNLVVLAAATSYINITGGKQVAVVYTSIGITLCQFIGIVVYQAYNILKQSWEERQQGAVGEARVNQEDYEPINEHHQRERWPPEAQYRHMDRCREPLLEEN